MANLVFYMDYGPLLSRVFKSAFLVYVYYDKLKDDQGIVQITYNELNEHLGLASSTIQKANKVLLKLELIEEVEGKTGKSYRLLPVKSLIPELKQEILSMTSVSDYDQHTSLRERYTFKKIPTDFQQLLNKKVLKKAYKDLGDSFTKGKELCKYFNIDYHTFKLLHERDDSNSFKTRLSQLMKEVVETSKSGKRKGQNHPDSSELTKFLYDKLVEYTGIRPMGNWWVKNCSIANNLLKSDLTLQEGKEIIEWALNDKYWKDKISDLKMLETLGTKYRIAKSQGKVKTNNAIGRSTPIPSEIQEEVNKKASVSIETYEDAYFLKESILSGDKEDDVVKAVDILEKRGIIPSGQNNLRFS